MGKSATKYYLASRCPNCGGAKTRPSVTAYVYCDYCGNLADYDFKKACAQPADKPGPVYEKLSAALKPLCDTALLAQDRDKYLAQQRRLFEAWVDACPNAVPVRVGDAVFKKDYVAHMAECATACAFDEPSKKISQAMTDATGKLQWVQAGGKPRASQKGFLPLIDTVIALQDRCYSDELQQQYTPHPDGASAELLKRIGCSLFVQGWLPYLDDATIRLLLEKTGLAGEYHSLEDNPSAQLHCGHCNCTIPVFQGATQCVCEQCGHKLEVARGLDCDGCGAHLAVNDRTREFPCPQCGRRVERVG